jgi:hypothetical protein
MDEPRSSEENNTTDHWLFGQPGEQDKLLKGLEDMYYLLSRNYPPKASLALVGNRYRLVKRQLQALQGMSCSEEDIRTRKEKELPPAALTGKTILLDGFNILIILETALSGGFVFEGLDGCYRDISSVHGTYKKAQHTEEALVIIGRAMQQLQLHKVIWVFDAPISNSGKLKAFCSEIAAQYGFPWEIRLENAPDKYLIHTNGLVCSSDAWVLNECKAWFNLGAWIINNLPEVKVLTLYNHSLLRIKRSTD